MLHLRERGAGPPPPGRPHEPHPLQAAATTAWGQHHSCLPTVWQGTVIEKYASVTVWNGSCTAHPHLLVSCLYLLYTGTVLYHIVSTSIIVGVALVVFTFLSDILGFQEMPSQQMKNHVAEAHRTADHHRFQCDRCHKRFDKRSVIRNHYRNSKRTSRFQISVQELT